MAEHLMDQHLDCIDSDIEKAQQEYEIKNICEIALKLFPYEEKAVSGCSQ